MSERKGIKTRIQEKLQYLGITRIFQRAVFGQNSLRSMNELPLSNYLNTLSENDRLNVLAVAGLIKSLQTNEELAGIGLALNAVGSSVHPESKRHHKMRDIDLRVLNSAETKQTRRNIIQTIQTHTRAMLSDIGWSFKEEDHTTETRMIPDANTGNLLPFLYWYNSDPCFIITPNVGTQIHLSISGVSNYPLDEYMQREHAGNQYFSQLVN